MIKTKFHEHSNMLQTFPNHFDHNSVSSQPISLNVFFVWELVHGVTGCNRGSVQNLVATGLEQSRNAKDREKPVHISPVHGCPYLEVMDTVVGPVAFFGRQKTGPDRTFKH
jgi:hypothetical protein